MKHDSHNQTKLQEPASLPETSLGTGLSTSEVQQRLAIYGYNAVPEKRENRLAKFLAKFWGLSAWMIEAIILLSWILQRYPDLYIVSALLVVNAVLSYAQEQRASGAIAALRHKLQVDARVLRDGAWQVVHAHDLAPGDVLRIRAGDFVPADVQLAEGTLSVDQSALTGESLEAEKAPGDMLYSGSVVRRGEATGRVALTGTRTYFGRTTELVQVARPKMHIEAVVSQVVRRLLIIVVSLLAVAVAVAVLRGASLLEMLPLLLVLLLGAVPVALPVMFTVSMAFGSMELARQGVLVTRLTASEDAATMDVLCVDKTGTITTNRLSLAEVVPLNNFATDDPVWFGFLASQQANQDPIDQAFISAAQQQGLDRRPFVQQSFAPFDSRTRRTEALIEIDGNRFRVTKGAVGTIAQACNLDAAQTHELEVIADKFAQKGYRTLAVARSDASDHLQVVGLASLYDKPRSDSQEFIAALKARGISVKMLTGDALPIAIETASSIGLGTKISRAADLQKLAHDNPTQAAELAEASDGFAEIYPEDKYAVVRSLQAKGHVVGMTGDGVNDSPALRQAEVGIAVNNAADVAKGAASVVLTQEGLSGILHLVENGRQIHQRISTWIINKISRTILKSAFVVGAYLLTGEFVISALAMLLMVFMTDFVKISLSTDNVRGSRTPESWNISGPVKMAVVLGILMALEAFGLLFIGMHYLGLDSAGYSLHTFSFLILFYFAMFSILVVRERGHFWHSRPSNVMLLALGIDLLVGTVIALVGLPGLSALPWFQVLLVLTYAFLFALVGNDLVKVFLANKLDF